MKKLLSASFLAVLVVGLSQGPAAANFCIHKPCIEIPVPPFPLVIPNVKITCIKCPCEQYHAPNPWYTYYPPCAYGSYPFVYYPAYGAPPAGVLPPPAVVPSPLPAPAPIRPAADDKSVRPTAASPAAQTAAKQSTKQYASAKDSLAKTFNNMKPTQAPQPAAQPAPVYQLQPIAGSDNYSYGAPSYWYGR